MGARVYTRIQYVIVQRLGKEYEANCRISEPTDISCLCGVFFVMHAGGSGAGSTGRN